MARTLERSGINPNIQLDAGAMAIGLLSVVVILVWDKTPLKTGFTFGIDCSFGCSSAELRLDLLTVTMGHSD